MRRWLAAAAGWVSLAGAAAAAPSLSTDTTTLLVVTGVAGADEYRTVFAHEADAWKQIASRAHAKWLLIDEARPGSPSDHDRLRRLLADEPKDGTGAFWLILVGHGSDDGRVAKFNLRGPDVTATELADWLRPFQRPLAVIDTSSASAPFLPKLSGKGRVIVTATRSGEEKNFARFGTYFAAAIGDPRSDLDKDGEVSLLEAFLSAAARVADFYRTAGRLASEHPLIDDNGDGLGTPPDWFDGVRAVKRPKGGATPDGRLAQQFVLLPSAAERELPPAVRAERDQLERDVAQLRDRKGSVNPDEYYAQLEQLLLRLARLYLPAAASGSSHTPAH